MSVINPIVVLPVKRKRDAISDWDSCIICHLKDNNLSVASENGLSHFITCYEERKKCNDIAFADVFDRLGELYSATDLTKRNIVKWHTKTCYATFCSKTNIERLKKRFAKASNKESNSTIQLEVTSEQSTVKKTMFTIEHSTSEF